MKRHLALAWLLPGLALMLIPFTVFLNTSANDAISDLGIRTNSPIAPTAIQAAPFATFTVTNNSDTGLGSLRAAIDQANTTPGTDLITFTPGLGTINVGSITGQPLMVITEAVTIDGGSPRVELNGAAAGAAAHGLEIAAPGVAVRGLVINRFSLSGILIQADNCIIQGNFIGTDATGTSTLANGETGVFINGQGNLIGGTALTARNVISGNGSFGIAMNSVVASNNTIQGNFIGTDVSGTVALGNAGGGVGAFGGTSSNTIGGTAPGAANTIANNAGSGVNIFGGANNAVLGNSIFSNGGLGIDLIDDGGVTPNDVCDGDAGANALQNFPVLTSANSGGGNTTIVGTLDSTIATTFRIEFFSNPNCDASGNGEGQTFIGATTVNTPLSGCVVAINSAFPVAVPVGSVITATATDPLNNTSEFSQCVTVTAAPVCTLTCPPDMLAFTSPSATLCGTVVTYSPVTSGVCGTVTCTPPSGSVFAAGTTPVSCTTFGSPGCSFTITVIDATPPRITCPAGFTSTLPAGQSSAVVNYPTAGASDNCAVATVVCTPPPGSTFSAGSTLVTCKATDVFDNASNCFFFVTLLDGEVPVIVCPPNVNASLPVGQTAAVVSYPPPTVTDNFPGVSFDCSPRSGSSFPAGTTTVTCTATDATSNKSSCSFIVSVGSPQAKVNIPGNKTAVEFAAAPTRKPPKPKNNPCAFFTIQNIGFSPLVLSFDSLKRTGADVTNGRIGDPNDVNGVAEIAPTKFIVLNRVSSDQSLTPLNVGEVLTLLQPGQAQLFCAKFAALIPGLAGKTTGLAASDVLPNLVTSTISFRQNAGANIEVPILARVSTGLVLVNLSNRRALPQVLFTRSGNDITVSYAVFDSNLDVSRAKYEFLDSSGQVVAGPFEIDLAASLSSANLVRGQSFRVEQRFTGARSNPEITSVRLTVFDGETSVSAPSTSSATSTSAATVQLMNRARRVTLYLPDVKLR